MDLWLQPAAGCGVDESGPNDQSSIKESESKNKRGNVCVFCFCSRAYAIFVLITISVRSSASCPVAKPNRYQLTRCGPMSRSRRSTVKPTSSASRATRSTPKEGHDERFHSYGARLLHELCQAFDRLHRRNGSGALREDEAHWSVGAKTRTGRTLRCARHQRGSACDRQRAADPERVDVSPSQLSLMELSAVSVATCEADALRWRTSFLNVFCYHLCHVCGARTASCDRLLARCAVVRGSSNGSGATRCPEMMKFTVRIRERVKTMRHIRHQRGGASDRRLLRESTPLVLTKKAASARA